MKMMINKISTYKKCLHEERFFDAHEVLEEVWFTRRFEESNEVKLLKGFINAAVSFELLKRGREKPAKNVWLTYLKYRQLLFKTKTPYLNDYYQLSRYLDLFYKKLH